MLQETFIKLPFVIIIFVLSIFEWPLKTGFTVFEFNIKTGIALFKLMLDILVDSCLSHVWKFFWFVPVLSCEANMSCSKTQYPAMGRIQIPSLHCHESDTLPTALPIDNLEKQILQKKERTYSIRKQQTQLYSASNVFV